MKGILIIHGFVGWNKDFDYLTKELDKTYKIVAPNLRGHEDLKFKGITNKHWVQDAIEAYKELETSCDEIYIIGHSMGGVIASIVNDRFQSEGKIKGLILLNPAFKHSNFVRGIIDLPLILLEYSHLVCKEKNPKRVIKRIITPRRTIKEFYNLVDDSKEIPRYNKTKTLLIQGTRDGLVRKKTAYMVCSKIKHDNKEIKFLKYGHNPYAASKKVRSEIITSINDFINERHI